MAENNSEKGVTNNDKKEILSSVLKRTYKHYEKAVHERELEKMGKQLNK
jgi:hypothetical protein